MSRYFLEPADDQLRRDLVDRDRRRNQPLVEGNMAARFVASVRRTGLPEHFANRKSLPAVLKDWPNDGDSRQTSSAECPP